MASYSLHQARNDEPKIKQEDNAEASNYDNFFTQLNRQLNNGQEQPSDSAPADPRKYGPSRTATILETTIPGVGLSSQEEGQIHSPPNIESPVLPQSTFAQTDSIKLPIQLSTPIPPSITDTMTGNSNAELPDGIIFSTATGSAADCITKIHLAMLPPGAFEKISAMFPDHPPTMTMRFLGQIAEDEFVLLKRLHTYLEQGDYPPFSSSKGYQLPMPTERYKPDVEYVNKLGELVKWEDNDSAQLYQVPEMTKELLIFEIETYLFADKLGFPQLRDHARNRIFSRYPKSATGIYQLVDRIYQTATTIGDHEMIGKIQVYIYQNAKRLTAAKWYGDLMIQFLKQPGDQLGEAMLRAHVNAHEMALKDVERLVKENKELKAAAGGPQPTTATIPPPPPPPPSTNDSKIPNGPASSRPRDSITSHSQEEFAAEDTTTQSPALRESQRCKSFLNQLLSASEEGMLVMANEDGWGTHLNKSHHLARDYNPRGPLKNQDRNRDFIFKRGEIFCVSREYRESIVGNSHVNAVVVNARGQYGDIQRARMNQLGNLLQVNYSQQLRGLGGVGEAEEGGGEGDDRKRKRDESMDSGSEAVKAERGAVDTWRRYRPGF